MVFLVFLRLQIYTIYIMDEIIEIRPIKFEDNIAIANIIKNTLIEYNGNKPGTAFNDKSLNNMFETYDKKNAIYFIALLNNTLVGGCGINLLDGGESSICELQKMYMSPQARGKKIGKRLLEKCIDFAIKSGFKKCYLATLPHLPAAPNLYSLYGFKNINHPMGNTGHTACDVWMLKELNQ